MASKSRRNKVKFKFTKELAFLLIALVAMITATIVMSIPSQAERALERYNTAIQSYNTANETQYGILDKDNVFEEISVEKLADISNKEAKDNVYVFYGSLNNATFLENLTKINAAAKNFEVEKVYLVFNTFVEEAEDPNSIEFKNDMDKKNASIAQPADGELIDALDLADIKNPALLVFNNKSLVFNTQTYQDNTEYNWNMFINQAFTKGRK